MWIVELRRNVEVSRRHTTMLKTLELLGLEGGNKAREEGCNHGGKKSCGTGEI